MPSGKFVAADVHSVMLIGAFVLYIVGARTVCRSKGWLARILYLGGGMAWAYYEIHMRIVWLVLGVGAIALAWVVPARVSGERSASDG